jgi:rare lipoprotein A
MGYTGSGSQIRGGAVLIACALLFGCSSSGGGSKPTTAKTRTPTQPTFQDGGPPPGTQLSAAQLKDPVPHDEPPSRYGNPVSYSVFGKRYTTMKSATGFQQRGLASWYGTKFHGRRTSSGEPYDMYAMTAAHKSLPLPTYVLVHNLDNNRTAIVRVNDRGPFHSGRIIDLSYAAAIKLGVAKTGVARVEIRSLSATDGPGATMPGRLARTTRIDVPLTPTPARPRQTTNRIELAQSGPGSAAAVGHPSRPGPQRPRAAGQGLFLQVGAFSSRHNAENLRSRMLAANLPAPNITTSQGSRTIYRLRIGPLANRRQADALLPGLAQVGIHSPRLLTVAN